MDLDKRSCCFIGEEQCKKQCSVTKIDDFSRLFTKKKEVANKIKNGKDGTDKRQKKSYCIFLGKRATQH